MEPLVKLSKPNEVIMYKILQIALNNISYLLVCGGEKWLYGCWFYRPSETFHLATRKFLEKEVFKSDYYNKVSISKVLGKCVVMFVKVSPPHQKLNHPE